MSNTKRKTLSMTETAIRQVRFSGTDKQDMTAYYKAYQLGALKLIHSDFDATTLMEKDEFETVFSLFVKQNNLLSVTFFGEKDEVEIPVGLALFWPRGRILEMTNMIWFPWASTRHVFLNSFNFFDGIRKTTHEASGKKYKILEFAESKDEKFFDKLVDMGVLEKVGKIDDLYPDGKAILYITKGVKD
jgi:hypothetical protein